MAVKSVNISKSKGFTLIEILVASIILFSVIATTSLVYRTAVTSSLKAEEHLYFTGVMPSIVTNIAEEVLELGQEDLDTLEGSGSALDVKYQWKASLLTFERAPEKLDVDSGNFVTPEKKYKLWQIELLLERNGKKIMYQYNELSWVK